MYEPYQNEVLYWTQRHYIVPGAERIAEYHTVRAGAGDLPQGAVLAQDSGNGNKLVPVDSQSATASIKEPFGVLGVEAGATEDDVRVVVFVKGYFHEVGLQFGGTDTADDHRAALREKGIYIWKTTEHEA